MTYNPTLMLSSPHSDTQSPQPAKPRVVIVGPGAMGCLHAGLLGRMPHLQVGLLDHRPDRAKLISNQGVIIEAPEGSYTVPTQCSANPDDFGTADLVIIFTKAYDTAAAAEHAEPLVSEDTAILTLQNGLGNYEVLQKYFPDEQVLAGTTASGATLLGPGRVRQAGLGKIVLGSPAGNHELAQRVAELLQSAGLAVQVTEDVDGLLWRKVLINCAINPLTALTRRCNGELLEIPVLRELLDEVAEEVYEVGQVAGVEWGNFAPGQEVKQVCQATATNQSSMLQDVLAGRRTEIDYITGAVVAAAQQHGVAAPLCQCLTALVKGLALRHG